MVRTPCCDKSGLKKGTWTPEEDNKLAAYVMRYGCWNWRQLPKYAGLARCGKSCRLRWMNYLRPNIKRGNYTKEEDEIISKLHEKLGNKWSVIAAHLPGRTDNEIKNHWHTSLKKHSKQQLSSTPSIKRKRGSSTNNRAKKSNHKNSSHDNNPIISITHEILESSQWSSQQSSSDSSSSTTTEISTKSDEIIYDQIIRDEFAYVNCDESFCGEPFLIDSYWSKNELSVPSTHEVLDSSQWSPQRSLSDLSSSTNTREISTKCDEIIYDQVISDEFAHLDCDDSFWSEPFLLDNNSSKDEFSVPSIDLEFLCPPSPFALFDF